VKVQVIGVKVRAEVASHEDTDGPIHGDPRSLAQRLNSEALHIARASLCIILRSPSDSGHQRTPTKIFLYSATG